jgi:RNA polymerase sigma-70 factor, ECF subfamily
MSEEHEALILSLMVKPSTRDKGFTLLMDTFKERIYWHIRRLVVSHEDAEDILQETFINAYRYASSFNNQSKLYTWLYRIATNECIRLFKQRKRITGKNQEIKKNMPMAYESYEPVNSDEILGKFQKAILQLPEKQRIVFNLRYYDELGYEEIGQILNSSVNALKTNYHYASERIKNFMINQ